MRRAPAWGFCEPASVERDDVARALPDRVHSRVTQQPRQARGLAVAVAAQALHRLGDVAGDSATAPVLHDRGGDSAHRRPVIAVLRRQVHQGNREVGQHVGHGGLVGQSLTEVAAVAAVVDRRIERGAHLGGDGRPGSGVAQIGDQRDHSPAVFAHQPAARAPELDLGRGQ
jgi:hypothetical protein